MRRLTRKTKNLPPIIECYRDLPVFNHKFHSLNHWENTQHAWVTKDKDYILGVYPKTKMQGCATEGNIFLSKKGNYYLFLRDCWESIEIYNPLKLERYDADGDIFYGVQLKIKDWWYDEEDGTYSDDVFIPISEKTIKKITYDMPCHFYLKHEDYDLHTFIKLYYRPDKNLPAYFIDALHGETVLDSGCFKLAPE